MSEEDKKPEPPKVEKQTTEAKIEPKKPDPKEGVNPQVLHYSKDSEGGSPHRGERKK